MAVSILENPAELFKFDVKAEPTETEPKSGETSEPSTEPKADPETEPTDTSEPTYDDEYDDPFADFEPRGHAGENKKTTVKDNGPTETEVGTSEYDFIDDLFKDDTPEEKTVETSPVIEEENTDTTTPNVETDEDEKKKLTFDENTFDKAKVDFSKAPENLLGTSGTLTEYFAPVDKTAAGGIQNPNQAPHIVGNIQGMEAGVENKIGRLSNEINKIGQKQIDSNAAYDNYKKTEQELDEKYSKLSEDVAKFEKDAELYNQKAAEGTATREEYEALLSEREELLGRKNEIDSLNNKLEEYYGKILTKDETEEGIRKTSELSSKLNDTMSTAPALEITLNRIGQDKLGNLAKSANKQYTDLISEIDSEPITFDVDNTKDAIENALKEMQVPEDQLNNMITSNEKYFDYIKRTGQEFSFDDWAKDSGIVGKLAQAGAAIGGGLVAGPLGYDAIKQFVESKVNDKLYKETGVARTDKQKVQSIETSLNNISKYTETPMDEETARAVASVYENDRKQFDTYYNSKREAYNKWFADKIDESGKVRDLSPTEYAEASKLNNEMSKLNDYKKQYNELEDKIGYTETETEKTYISTDGNQYTREELENGSNEFWDKLSTPEDKAYYIMFEAADIDGGGDVSYELVHDFQNYISKTYGNGAAYFSNQKFTNDLSKALASDDQQVKDYLQQMYNETKGIYSSDFGTGKAAKAIVGLNENAKQYGQKQGQFYSNSIIDLPNNVANYYDDFDMDATMNNDASPATMEAKYQEYWNNASDEQKMLAQIVEKLEPKENGSAAWWTDKDQYSFGADYSQTLNISDNGKEWLVAQILDNKQYADAILKGYVGSQLRDLYKASSSLPDKEEDESSTGVKVNNYFVNNLLGTKLVDMDYQQIYNIYKAIAQAEGITDDSIIGNKDYQDIYTIDKKDIEDDNNTNISEETQAETEDTSTEESISDEELARIFGVAYDESNRKKSDYNYGLQEENAYSDEDVKVFITGLHKDPVFRAFVKAVRGDK